MLASHHADLLCAAALRLGSESAFEVLSRARTLEAQGRHIVHMEIGEPDFDAPEHVKQATIDAILANESHYTPSAGIAELRDTVAHYAGTFRGISPFARENVVVGPGAKPLIWNTLSALLDPGDELVYAEPAYPAYASAAGYLGADARTVTLRESRGFRFDLDEFAATVSAKTKVVIINSPQNPTGGVLTRDDLRVVADLAHRYDFLVISDEIYSRNLYDRDFVSIAQFEDMRDRTIIIDGFSKAYAMTGYRLGYAIMPERLAHAVTMFDNNTFSCVTTFVQRAGIAALTGDDRPVQMMNATFRQRRDAIVAGLNAIDGISCTIPDGAFYAFPNVSRITADDKHLASYLLEEAGVGALGGSCFGPGGTGYMRFSYAASLDDIALALERIREALSRYR